MNYDVIGDVHGCADKLEALLAHLGYRCEDGVYRHPSRQAVFVGDLVDRGHGQLRVLQIVKAMVDAGTARITMGNHEFNAIAYATRDPRVDGQFLRPHTEKNANQHRAFVDQLTGLQQAEYIQWFRTFQLWLDLGGLRVVHACWHAESMKLVERELGSNSFVSDYQLARASSKGDPLYEAVEILLKGPEIAVEPPYLDKDAIEETRRVCAGGMTAQPPWMRWPRSRQPSRAWITSHTRPCRRHRYPSPSGPTSMPTKCRSFTVTIGGQTNRSAASTGRPGRLVWTSAR